MNCSSGNFLVAVDNVADSIYEASFDCVVIYKEVDPLQALELVTDGRLEHLRASLEKCRAGCAA